MYHGCAPRATGTGLTAFLLFCKAFLLPVLFAAAQERGSRDAVHGLAARKARGPQQGKLRSLGLDRWAEAKLVFISDACGVMKPAPEIFRLAQTAAGGGPCVFVGDSCSQDIAGASACGWQTIWLSRTGEEPTAAPTLTARSEQDLLPCLQALAE